MYPKRQTIVGITFWTLGESRGKNTRMDVAPSFELGSATGAGCRCPDHFVFGSQMQRRAVVVLLFAASNFSSKSYELSLFERWFFRTFFFKKLSLGVLCVLGVISLFVTALRHFFLWISFELPFTVLCVLGGPSLSVPALLFLFLNFLFSNLLEFCVRGPERFFGKRKVCCRQKRIVLKSFGPCHSHGNRAA